MQLEASQVKQEHSLYRYPEQYSAQALSHHGGQRHNPQFHG